MIIPNKDHSQDLDTCIRSLMERSTYQNLEFIVVENNSTSPETFAYYKKLQEAHSNVKVVTWKEGFNYSAINNFGASFASGEYLLLLNNDTELLEPDSYRGGRAFYDFTPRIIYKNSQVHPDSDRMDYYEGKLNHLWVDLFILDKLPEGKLASEMTRFIHKAIYGLAMGHRHDLDYSRYSLLHKIFVGGLATAGKLIPLKWIISMQKWAALKDRKSKGSRWYYSNYQPDYLYVTLEDDWCTKTEDAPFEDTQLMIPKGYHQVLTEVYGDYMQLPPEDKRVPTHSSQQIRVFD